MTKLKLNLIFISLIFLSEINFSQDSNVNLFINEFMASNSNTIADPDYNQYSDWIEIYNANDSTVNLSGYYLTDDLNDKTKWQINTDIIVRANSFVGFWADDGSKKNHTNFKLLANSGEIGLFSPNEILVDSIIYSTQTTDKSFGRFPDGAVAWNIFDIPTPGTKNNNSKTKILAPSPVFSVGSGFSKISQIIEISSELDSAKIYFTVDGSIPTEKDSLYSNPIEVLQTTVIRASVFKKNFIPSKPITNTYFINENSVLPIFSITTNPDNFFSNDSGIYVAGTNGIAGNCSTSPRNWNQDWERTISLEFFEADKNLAFKVDAGIKINGGCTRLYNQKSLAIFMKGEYGLEKLDYQLFPFKQIYRFNNFILRSSAQDWYRTMFRDGMIQTLIKAGMDIDYQEYRPAVVFINGEYWGIHNIREKLNEHYLEANHGVNPDSVDIIEISKEVIANKGDKVSYDNLINFVSTNDLSLETNYNYIKSIVDIDEYINYQIAEIYSANADWPGSNSKLWRPRTKKGKWRWMIYDMDFGFGGNSQGQYFSNTLELATATNGEDWPNPPWSTLLLRRLLQNENFKNEFIQRFAVQMHTTFDVSRVINLIDSLQANIAPEIPRHKERWAKSISYGDWNNLVEIMREFARNRPSYVSEHFKDKFELSGMESLIIENTNILGGKIILHSTEIQESNYSITLFKDVPVKLEAIPMPGYRFAGWQGLATDSAKVVSFYLDYPAKIIATFVKDSVQSTDVVINEINYNSSSAFDTDDWIELYNNTDSTINISGWIFKDEVDTHNFTFNDNLLIGARKYLILCKDTTMFNYFNPSVDNILGNFDFGLSGSGELIRLFDEKEKIIDSLTYGDSSPWAVEADGNGATLEFINPSYDNSLAKNWVASNNHGSPGKINGVYTEVEKQLGSEIPAEFILEQNYPNPFNPTTEINFALPQNGNVKLVVFNSIGQQVMELINNEMVAGFHKVNFDASRLSSGIYFYSISSGNFTNVKKMILMK
jgi:CotH kinase protein/Lamin Tail Domain/Chitobiase/beta-hexosaminidase C-terminal domain/Secretion system C-terminal sorting domain